MADNTGSIAEIQLEKISSAQDFPFNPLAIVKTKYISPFLAHMPKQLFTGVAMKNMDLEMLCYPRAMMMYPYFMEHDTLLSTLGGPCARGSSHSLLAVEPPQEISSVKTPQKTTIADVRSLQYTQKRDNIADDPYDEELSELKFMQSRPVTFMVIGKPSIDNLKLAQKIADYWGCICIDPESSLKVMLNNESAISAWCLAKLCRGLSIPSGMMMRLMEQCVLSEEVAHRGYVLCGLPFLPADVEADPTVQEQLDMVLSWHIQPQVFIYIMCPDGDVMTKNSNIYFDYTTGNYINRNVYYLDKKVRVMFTHDKRAVINEDIMNMLYSEIEQEKDLVDQSAVRHLVHLPQSSYSVSHYDHSVMRYVEHHLSQLDPQCIIRVDGRTTPVHMMRIVKARLDALPLRRAYTPQRMTEPRPTKPVPEENLDEEDEPEEPEEPEDEEPIESAEDKFPELSANNCPGPKYKWRLSHWGYYCPVALWSALNIQGTSDNAVRFLDKLYFMSSPEATNQFVMNPRPYLILPNPQPACKFYIVGPPHCGKSVLSQYLARMFNGKVITVETLFEQHLNASQLEALAEVCNITRTEAKGRLEKENQENFKQIEANWKEKVQDWQNSQIAWLKEMKPCETEQEDSPASHKTSSIFLLPSSGFSIDYPDGITLEQQHWLLENPDELLQFLPKELTMPVLIPVTDDEPSVQQCVQEAVQRFKAELEPMELEEKAMVLKEAIFNIQDKRLQDSGGSLCEGGWVLDGMPLELELWQQLEDAGLLPEEVICLQDHDPEFEYLVSKWRAHLMGDIDNFYLLYPGYISMASLMNWLNCEPSSLEMNQTPMEVSENLISSQNESLTASVPHPNVESKISATTLEAQLEKYMQVLLQFKEDWKALQDAHNMKSAPMEVNVNKKHVSYLISEVAKRIEARYRISPKSVGEEELDEEMDVTAADITIDENVEEEEKTVMQSGQLVGDTANFCPVVFHTKGVLWPGKDALMLKFHNKIYTFSSEEAMEKFQQRPWEVAPHRNPVFSFPPVRICIVGPIGSGKTTIASKIAFQLGMLHRDFLHDIDTILTPNGMQKVGRKHEDSTKEIQGVDNGSITEEDDPGLVLSQYLKEGMPVPDKLLSSVLAPLWESEPYLSRGFIYSGFPMHPQDFDIMKRHCLIPDVIIQLNLEDSNVMKTRVLQEYIDLWKARQDLKKKDVKDREKKIREEWKEAKEKRMQELIREYNEEMLKPIISDIIAFPFANDAADDPPPMPDVTDENATEDFEASLISESQMFRDISETLLQELPQPERELHDWETMREARERLELELQDWLDADLESLETIKTLAEEENIPWLDINASTNGINDVCNEIMHHIVKYKHKSASLFEKTYMLSMDQADKMLHSGYLFLSKFARWCPVQIAKKEVPILMYTPLSRKNGIYPVVHRRYIYFLAGKDNRDVFMRDPLKYTNQNMDQPVVPVKLAVVGPPKSGKTTLSERLSDQLGLKVITVGQSIRYVLDEMGWSELAITMQLHLQQGETLPTELLVQSIEAATMDPRCATQGFVLDGFPNTAQHLRELANAVLVPYLIIALNCSLPVCTDHLQSNQHTAFSHAPLFSLKLLQHKYDAWQGAAKDGLQWAQHEYQNVKHLDGERVAWWVGEHAKEHVFQVVDSIATYFKGIDKDLAVRLDCMCVTQQEFEARQSNFGNYCPICLKHGHLTNGSLPPNKQGLVQYQEHYYWVCSQHLTAFLTKPVAFVSPINTATLPKHIPTPVDPSEVHVEEVAKGGNCIVTYCENLPQRRLVTGWLNHAVRYKEQVFLFANKKCKDLFIHEPETYCDREILQLQHSLPPLQTTNLPCMGFLEQTASTLIHKAVTLVGTNRPKYPGLNSNISAAVYIGYCLKTLNPHAPWNQQCRFEEARQLFMARCHILERLYQASHIHNPFQKYAGAGEPC